MVQNVKLKSKWPKSYAADQSNPSHLIYLPQRRQCTADHLVMNLTVPSVAPGNILDTQTSSSKLGMSDSLAVVNFMNAA